MTRDDVRNEYFEWLLSQTGEKRYSKQTSYEQLLTHLHDVQFRYLIPKDQNRAEDGIALRYRFVIAKEYEDQTDWVLDILGGPCSILEMMVALAIRCEEGIMDDPGVGDRTSQWFWTMLANLSLSSMVDARYDERFVDDKIDIFLDRRYDPDGKGGLFRIRDCERDLRDVEIWVQLCWYLDSIV